MKNDTPHSLISRLRDACDKGFFGQSSSRTYGLACEAAEALVALSETTESPSTQAGAEGQSLGLSSDKKPMGPNEWTQYEDKEGKPTVEIREHRDEEGWEGPTWQIFLVTKDKEFLLGPRFILRRDVENTANVVRLALAKVLDFSATLPTVPQDLINAARNAEAKLAYLGRSVFGDRNFTDRYQDGPNCIKTSEALRKALDAALSSSQYVDETSRK
jgi:hypothetical protein